MDNTSLFFQIFSLSGQNLLLDGLMKFATGPLIYLMFLLTLILAIKGNASDKKSFLILILAIPISILIIKGIHLFLFEPRPFVAFHFTPLVKETADASFPSRHTTISSVIAFSFLFFKSKWSPLFLFAALWIGISRIYVGVHYPLDILGGFIVGIISLIIALQIKKLLKKFFLPA